MTPKHVIQAHDTEFDIGLYTPRMVPSSLIIGDSACFTAGSEGKLSKLTVNLVNHKPYLPAKEGLHLWEPYGTLDPGQSCCIVLGTSASG